MSNSFLRGFIVCWTPSQVYDLLTLIGVVGYTVDILSLWLYQFSIAMMLINSCINPLIYAAKYRESVPDRTKYREFQTAVRRMLRRQVEPSVQPVHEMHAGNITGH